MSKITIIGSSNTDLVVKTYRIPSPGETIIGGDFAMIPGGKGANQAVTVARLAGAATFVASVGDDMFGTLAKEGYAKDGIDTSYIVTQQGIPSGMALISVDSRGENSIVVAPGANNALTCDHIDAARAAIEESEYMLIQLEIPMPVVEYAVDIAHKAGVKVILNPAPAAKLSDELLAKLYLITPNETEAALLTGMETSSAEQVAAAATTLRARGVDNVIVTMGTHGSYILSDTLNEVVSARKVDAVDTTAAGDVFNGALVVALSEGASIIEAMRFATLSSSISVTRMGAQSSIPQRDELNALLNDYKF